MTTTFPRPNIPTENPEAWLTEEEADGFRGYNPRSIGGSTMRSLSDTRRALHEANAHLDESDRDTGEVWDVATAAGCPDGYLIDAVKWLAGDRDEARKRAETAEGERDHALGATMVAVAQLEKMRAECDRLRACVGSAEGLDDVREVMATADQELSKRGIERRHLRSALAVADTLQAEVRDLRMENGALEGQIEALKRAQPFPADPTPITRGPDGGRFPGEVGGG